MSEMPNTMVGNAGSAGSLGGGAGSHKEAFLAGIMFAYKMGTEILGAYFETKVIEDIRAGKRPEDTYTQNNTGGGAISGPLEKMLASYEGFGTSPLNSYERASANKASGYSAATYLGDMSAKSMPENTSYTGGSYTNGKPLTYSTVTGPRGPDTYTTQDLYTQTY